MSNIEKTKPKNTLIDKEPVQDTISQEAIHSILDCECEDVFAYLGSHRVDNEHFAVRACIPGAKSIDLMDNFGNKVSCLDSWKGTHFFHVVISAEHFSSYTLLVTDDSGTRTLQDPYRFGASISVSDLYLFAEGTNDRSYNFLAKKKIFFGDVDDD